MARKAVKTTADGNPRLPAVPVAQGEAFAKRGRGRPPVLAENWSKATVALLERQIVALDRLSADIREKTGKSVNRAALIRAGIDALLTAQIDPATLYGEADVLAALLAKMGQGERR